MPEYSNSQLGKFEGTRYACKGVIDRLMLAPDGTFWSQSRVVESRDLAEIKGEA